jgi:hypothetical protein
MNLDTLMLSNNITAVRQYYIDNYECPDTFVGFVCWKLSDDDTFDPPVHREKNEKNTTEEFIATVNAMNIEHFAYVGY